jgi:hypothetical protein
MAISARAMPQHTAAAIQPSWLTFLVRAAQPEDRILDASTDSMLKIDGLQLSLAGISFAFSASSGIVVIALSAIEVSELTRAFSEPTRLCNTPTPA